MTRWILRSTIVCEISKGRKAIVLFTDGVDSSSERSNYMRTVSDAERSDVIIYPVRYDTSEYNGGQNTNRFPWPNRRGGGWRGQQARRRR